MVEHLKKILSKVYLALIIVFLYSPILVLAILSFNNSKSRVKWGGFTLKWYESLFQSRQVREALSTTLILAVSAALIATIIGVLGALGIHAMKRKNYQLMMAFTNIPMLNSDIVTGIALMLWFVHFMPLGFNSLLISHITFCIPYVILSVMPKIEQMNISLYEAARDLGASASYGFFKVVFPQLAGGIVSGFFLAFTMSMDDFVITYFTKGAGVNTLSTMIYAQLRRGVKPELYALSTLIFVVSFVVLIFANYGPFAKKKVEN